MYRFKDVQNTVHFIIRALQYFIRQFFIFKRRIEPDLWYF